MKLPLHCGHYGENKERKPGEPFGGFIQGPDEHGAFDSIEDADGETVLSYAGCGSHRFEIDLELIRLIESAPMHASQFTRMRAALEQIIDEAAHRDTCHWYWGELCDCHIGIAAKGLGKEVESL